MKIDREKVYTKYNGKCSYCGEDIKISDMQVDHIIPKTDFIAMIKNKFRIPEFLQHLTLGDLDHIDNLNPSCRVCNLWKNAHHLELFRSEIQDQVYRLNKRSANYRIAKKYGLIIENEKPIEFYFEKVTNSLN